jgi:hypothetical protein
MKLIAYYVITDSWFGPTPVCRFKEQSLQRHEQFDEDTSMIYSPRRQKWWLATVEGELRRGH